MPVLRVPVEWLIQSFTQFTVLSILRKIKTEQNYLIYFLWIFSNWSHESLQRKRFHTPFASSYHSNVSSLYIILMSCISRQLQIWLSKQSFKCISQYLTPAPFLIFINLAENEMDLVFTLRSDASLHFSNSIFCRF